MSRLVLVCVESEMSEFDAYMAGFVEYSEMTPAGQAQVDEYEREYDAYIERLCEGSYA